jgi:hypothetical protein
MQEPYIRLPLAATITCAVIQRALSPARKVAVRATSCGCAIRPRGVVFPAAVEIRLCGVTEARRGSVLTIQRVHTDFSRDQTLAL